MPEYVLNGCRYYAATHGRGESLLLLHGFTGSHANWTGLIPALTAQFQIIAPDLVGHGRTAALDDPGRYEMARVAADLEQLLTQRDVEQTYLLGYSMGGRLALYFALHYPERVRALVLESASPGLETAAARAERRRRDATLADRIERDGVEAFVDFWESLPLWDSQKQLSQAARDTLRRQRLQNAPRGLANSLRGMGTGAQPSLWGRLAELTLPVLLIAGALDEKFVNLNQRMAAALPRARLEIVPGAGHALHLERPEAVTYCVLRFLRSDDLFRLTAKARRAQRE